MRTSLAFLAIAVAAASSAQSGFRMRSLEAKGPSGWIAKASFPEFTRPFPLARLAGEKWREEVQTVFDEFVANAKASENAPNIDQWSFEAISRVSVVSPRLVSGYTERSVYSGGAHPNTYFQFFNLTLAGSKAKPLGLGDLTNGEDGYRAATRIALETLNATRRQRGLDPLPALTPRQADMFVVTPAGITWMFQPYEVGAYVEGAYVAKVAWPRLRAAIDPNGPAGPLAAPRRS